jgi:hypothetical protein
LKTLRKGCLAGADGNQLSSGPSVNGELRRPNTEITGEEFKGKVSLGLQHALGEQIWDLKNLSLKHELEDLAKAAGFAHSTPENYKYDAAAFDW